MGDQDWREAERRLIADPGDDALVAQAIAARRRAGVPVPWRLLSRVVQPGFELELPAPLGVLIDKGRGWRALGPARPRAVPPHVRWMLQPTLTNRFEPGLPAVDWLTGLSRWPSDPPTLNVNWYSHRVDLTWVRRLRWLNELQLGPGVFHDSDLAPLEGLERLEALTLASSQVTDAGLVRLASLPGLSRLEVHCDQIGDTGMGWIARLERLTDLFVTAPITGRGLARLARLPHLDMLIVQSPALDDAAVAAFRAERPDVSVVRRPD